MQVKPFFYQSFGGDEPRSMAAHHGDSPEESHAEEEVEATPPPPSFSEAELEAAKAAALEEGFMKGKQEGLREIDHQQAERQQAILEATQAISQKISTLSQNQQQQRAQLTADAASLTLFAAKKVAGHALHQNPVADINAAIETCTASLFGSPALTLTLHPDIASMLKEMPQFSKVSFEEDASLSPQDCRIHWPYGHAQRDNAQIWAEIETIIERHFAHDTLDEESATPHPNNPEAEANQTLGGAA